MLMVLFIIINVFEFYSWSNIGVRTVIFYMFLSVVAVVLGTQVIVPLIHLMRMGKIISHKEAAIIIGNHFPKVSDKLLNTLQLQSALKNENKEQLNLLLAGINQKTQEFSSVSFRDAVTYKSNYKYLKWLALPFVFLVVVFIISPAFIVEPVSRIVNHSIEFEKPQPYTYEILNDSLVGIQGDEFTIQLLIKGDESPEFVYFNDGKYDFRLSKNKSGIFEYTITKLKNDIYFKIVSDEVISDQFHLIVLPKPSISSFNIELDFPDYINKKNQLIESTGDIIVPVGTALKWRFYTHNSENIVFYTGMKNIIESNDLKNVFEYSLVADVDFNYSIYSISEHKINSDTLNYSVNIVNDEKPTIVINTFQEEYLLGYLMVSGTIEDDYGFSSLRFYYKTNKQQNWSRTNLDIERDIEKQNFNHSFNTSSINILPGDNFEYYYEVWDNDGVNGYKSSKTKYFTFNIPDKEKIIQESDSTSDLMKSKYEMSIKDLEKLSKEVDELKKSMFEKKKIDWSDRKKVKDLIKSEKEMRESLQEMQELNSKRDELKDFLQNNPNQSIQDKLDKLTEQIEKLEQNDLLKLLEEKLKDIDEMNKDQLDQLLDQLKENQEEFKDNLEQQLEFFKQLELEQKLSQATDDIKALAEEQQKLADETKEKENKLEDINEQQSKLNKEFEKIEEKIQEIDSLNSELEKPLNLDNKQEKQDEIEEEMQNASDNLSSGKRKKSNESQNNAAQKLEELANQLDMMMQGAMESRMGEDVEQTKKILDNLLDISFNMEDLMQMISKTSDNDPKFSENTTNLKILKDDYSILHDSLLAISKRQIMLQRFLIRESNNVEMYIQRSLVSIQERRIGQTSGNLQYAMTSANNLALMLDESLDQMKQSMNMPGSQSGDAKCNNPGSGKKPGEGMKEMLQMQKSLGKGMQKGGMQKGKASGQGNNGESEALARMAAQQSELRKQLQQMMDELKAEGGNGNALQKIIDQMELQEKDIVNKQITSETLQRQKDIETRLLRAEKALLEREKEEQREATQGENKKRGNNNIEIQYNDNSIDNRNSVINKKPIKLAEPYKKLLKNYIFEIDLYER